jgi:DNA adenine methylase
MGVRQPFSYYGGKQKMVRHILPIVDSIPHTVYGEPFCGGASVLFAREARAVGNGDHYREFINDANDWVTTFYRVGKLQPEALIRLIDATLYSESDYRKAKAILKDSVNHDDLEVAWAFYIQANMSFANRLLAGWGTGVVGRNLQATWNTRKLTLPAALDRLSKVAISCGDALACIKRWDSPQTLFYLDPPYPSTNQGHYDGYTMADYQALCDTLDTIQGSYILSNYPSDVKPQSADRVVEVETMCSANGKGKVNANKSKQSTAAKLGDRRRTETLLICDRSANMRPELVPIAAKYTIEQRLDWLESKVEAIDHRSKKTAAILGQLSLFEVAS